MIKKKEKKYGKKSSTRKKKRTGKKSTKKKVRKKSTEKKYREKGGKPGCPCAHPFGVTSGFPIGHAQWYSYYSTTVVQNVGENDVTKEKMWGK